MQLRGDWKFEEIESSKEKRLKAAEPEKRCPLPPFVPFNIHS